MSISAVGSYPNVVSAYRVPASGPVAAASEPTGGGLFQSQSGGPSVGRMLSWGGGAFAGFRYVLPTVEKMFNSGNPSVLMIGGVVLGGAIAGNWLYNKLTGK